MLFRSAIESVAPRTSLFYRSDAFHEKLIAANVTQVCGVVAPGLSLDEELIHRWSIAAEAQGCRFTLAANKSDLPGFDELLARLEPFARLGYGIVELSATIDASPLLPWLTIYGLFLLIIIGWLMLPARRAKRPPALRWSPDSGVDPDADDDDQDELDQADQAESEPASTILTADSQHPAADIRQPAAGRPLTNFVRRLRPR